MDISCAWTCKKMVSVRGERLLHPRANPKPTREPTPEPTPEATTEATPKPTPLCIDGYAIEYHTHEAGHGDICRKIGGGGHNCPYMCKQLTPVGAPYCTPNDAEEAGACSDGSTPMAQPCRAPGAPGATDHRCDPFGGERGVCIKAEGHEHYTGQGDKSFPECATTCGIEAPLAGCATDWDCSLAGVCISGKCQCDPWTTGSDCSYLNFEPVDKSKLGYVDATHTSWGGSILKSQDENGDVKYNLIVAEIACKPSQVADGRTRCGLNNWKTDSQVAHAVADHPAGPYTRQKLLLAPTKQPGSDKSVNEESFHNPTTHFSPADNSWNLYAIRKWDGPIVVTKSTDFGETWLCPGSENDVNCHGTHSTLEISPWQNPGPLIHANGSVTMYYRYETDELEAPNCSPEAIAMQHCSSTAVPCKTEESKPVFRHTGEDPSVFIDHRGNYHMLLNTLPWACLPKDQQGGHAWSRDGITWSEPRVGAYNTTVPFTDGTVMTCERRERPQMLLDDDGRPLAMVTGILNCPCFGNTIYTGGVDSFTLVQEMAHD